MTTPHTPQKAQIDDVFDLIDLLYDLMELFNALFRLIYNFGQLLNGEQPAVSGSIDPFF